MCKEKEKFENEMLKVLHSLGHKGETACVHISTSGLPHKFMSCIRSIASVFYNICINYLCLEFQILGEPKEKIWIAQVTPCSQNK